MRVAVEIIGSIQDAIESQYRDKQRAAQSTMIRHAERAKLAWRAQIEGAGLGRRLANTVRAETYPRNRASLNAAAYIYSRAPAIIRSFQDGVTIKGKDGLFLAIPTENVPRKRGATGGGRGGTRLTPLEVERRFGGRLRMVIHGRNALLFLDVVRTKSGKGFRKAPKRGDPRLRKNLESVLMFVLVPQVTMPKRLDLEAVARNAGAELAADLTLVL